MESEFIAWLREQLPDHPQLRLGPGDDAAVLRLRERADCVVTTDLLSDGVDFRLGDADPRHVGRKALAVNLSDLAAMAARPLAAVVALLVPRHGGGQLARQLYEGMLPLATRHETVIAGGDTNSWDGPLAIAVTAIGETTRRGPLRRSGGLPGDAILVTGSFGGSILGRHLQFEPRIEEAMLLHERYELHAGIDVSDGLSVDLAHITRESGCGAALDVDRIPVTDAAYRLSESLSDGTTPLEHALVDGEDFELILTLPLDEAQRLLADQPLDVPVTRIGTLINESGLWRVDADGGRRPLAVRGWEH